MFIRRTQTCSNDEHYFTFRLVRSERSGAKVRQRTLLNLGRHFDVARSDWPVLCRRIDDLLAGQLPLPPDCPPALESHAQRIAAQLLAHERVGTAVSPAGRGRDVQHVDVDSLELEFDDGAQARLATIANNPHSMENSNLRLPAARR